VPQVEQELFTLADHMSSPTAFSGVRVAPILVYCVVFCRSLFVCLSFCPFSFSLSIVPLRFTALDYPFVFSNFSFGHSIVYPS